VPWRGPSTVVRGQAGLIGGMRRCGGGLGERRAWVGGFARASGSTASCAWHSCACDIRLTDRHDVRSGHARARGIRVSPGPSNQFRDVPLACKGNETTSIHRRGLPDRPEPGRRHSSPGPTTTCRLSALGSPLAGPEAWTRPAARRTQAAARRRPAQWPQSAVGAGGNNSLRMDCRITAG